MMVNYPRPGRFHLILRGTDVWVYVTLWLFGWRLHWCRWREGRV